MVYCCAQRCKSVSDAKRKKSTEKVSFHVIPTKPELRAVWIKNIGRKNWKPTVNSRICSKHFTKDQYRQGGLKLRCLLPKAIPTIFEGRKPLPPPRPRLPELVKSSTTFEIVGNVTMCKSSETSGATDETCSNNSGFVGTHCGTVVAGVNGICSAQPGMRQLIVVSKGTKAAADDGTKYGLLEIPPKPGETKYTGKMYKFVEISSDILERAKSSAEPILSAISSAADNNGQHPKVSAISGMILERANPGFRPILSAIPSEAVIEDQHPELPEFPWEAQAAADIPLQAEVKEHRETKRKLKATEMRLYRMKTKAARQENEIAVLKANLKKITAVALLEKLTNIQQDAREDKLHATFLLCQIKGYGRRQVSCNDKLMRCFKYWRALSAKGYDFPHTCGLLRLPHRSSLRRHADSDQVDAAINAAIQVPEQFPGGTDEDVLDAADLFDECEVAVSTIPSEEWSAMEHTNPDEQLS